MAVIERFIDESIFELAVAELRGVYEYLSKRRCNEDIPIWNMQLRRDNQVFLYYQGFAIRIKLYKNESKFTLKADEKICKSAGGLFNKKIAVNKLASYLTSAIEEIEKSIMALSISQIERLHQQYIATCLENDKDFLVIDMEVVRQNKERDIETNKFKEAGEGDLLALVRNEDASYSFLPIELKRMGEQGYNTAISQVISFANIIKNPLNIECFIKNYCKVYEQKRDIGIISGNETIKIRKNIDKVLVVLLADQNHSLVRKYENIVSEEYTVTKLTTTLEDFVELKWR